MLIAAQKGVIILIRLFFKIEDLVDGGHDDRLRRAQASHPSSLVWKGRPWKNQLGNPRLAQQKLCRERLEVLVHTLDTVITGLPHSLYCGLLQREPCFIIQKPAARHTLAISI